MIRDPAKMFTSSYEHCPDFDLVEPVSSNSISCLNGCYTCTARHRPVIVADDLLEYPPAIVGCDCRALGIEFVSGALSRAPGEREAVSWYDAGSWHGNLRASDGLKPQPRKCLDINEAPARAGHLCAGGTTLRRIAHAPHWCRLNCSLRVPDGIVMPRTCRNNASFDQPVFFAGRCG